MEELVPLLLGVTFGAVLWGKTSGHARIGGGVVAVVAAAVLATLVSGEFRESWVFLLLDAALAALGVAAGFLLMRAWPRLLGDRGLEARDTRQAGLTLFPAASTGAREQ